MKAVGVDRLAGEAESGREHKARCRGSGGRGQKREKGQENRGKINSNITTTLLETLNVHTDIGFEYFHKLVKP